MFNFTPLLGARSASPASQSLLELDGGIKILVDVGWDEAFDIEKLKELESHVPTLSIILLTHATTAHLAAFAHCCKHIPLFSRIPVYATTPVISLGRTLFQDLYASTPLASSIIPQSQLSQSAYSFPTTKNAQNSNILFQTPSSDEVAGYFSRIHPLKYSQPHEPIPSPFSPPLNGLTITAYSAGHSLGGTIWHIQHGMESIVYAVDWNQAREHVLAGASWLGGAGGGGAEVIEPLRRPTALVCSSRGAERVAVGGGMTKRDEALMNLLRSTIAKGGSVLIPSDSSARILELAYLLEHELRKDMVKGNNGSFGDTKLYLAGRAYGATMRLVRSMLEWMDEELVREFEAAANEAADKARKPQRDERKATGEAAPRAPFDFKRMKVLETKSRVNRALSSDEPKIILASDASLEWGFSKEALRKLCDDDRNLIILTERAGESHRSQKTLGRYLWDLWNERRAASGKNEDSDETFEAQGAEATLTEAATAPLAEGETSLYQNYLARQRQRQNTTLPDNATTLETSADVVDDRSESTSTTSEDSDAEHQGKLLNVSAAMANPRRKLGLSDAELGINILLRRKGVHDFDVRSKKGREKMFPYVSKRTRNDEFGDVIQPEEYLRAEERDEVAGEEMRNGDSKAQIGVGQKRRWDDVATKNGRRSSIPGNKRRKAVNGEHVPGKADGETSKGDAAESSDESDESEDEAGSSQPEGPKKVTITKESLQLKFRIAFVDFSGLHDRRSLHMLIPLIRPRKLVLVAGEEQETLALATDCRRILETDGGEAKEGNAVVFTPLVGETIDASVDTNAWSLRLSQLLSKKLHWQNVKGLSVVTITGRLGTAPPDEQVTNERAKKKLKASNTDGDDSTDADAKPVESHNAPLTPMLDVVPASMAAANRVVAQPLHVGDWRLVDLRKIMQASGHTADFQGEGTLLIDGLVAVRKSGTGRLEIEAGVRGTPGQRNPDSTFYAVKRKVYEGLAVVGSG